MYKEVKLFHKDVFLPKQITVKCQQLHTKWGDVVETKHIKEHFLASIKDRSHNYTWEGALQSLLNTKDAVINPFEVEIIREGNRWTVTKYCIRIKYLDSNQDICFSLRSADNGKWNKLLLVTAWMNSSTDNHRTLDSSKYDRFL